jgi:hypothetical protein
MKLLFIKASSRNKHDKGAIDFMKVISNGFYEDLFVNKTACSMVLSFVDLISFFVLCTIHTVHLYVS